MSFYEVSQAMRKELSIAFDEKMCNALIKLVEEIYHTNDENFQKLFESKQEYFIITLIEKMRETFATQKDLTALEASLKQIIAELKQELKEDFANVRQEISSVRQELKEDFANVRQEISSVRQELKEDITNVKQEISSVRQELKEDIANVRQEISSVRQELKEDISSIKLEMEKNKQSTIRWLIGIGITATLLAVSANATLIMFFIQQLKL